MKFQSLTYLLFLLVLWCVSSQVRSIKGRQWVLLIASYGFYATLGWAFLGVLIVSSLVNYVCGQLLIRRNTLTNLLMGVGFNLLILGCFKYLPSFAGTTSDSGLGHLIQTIAFPVGISFWTFQALSYLFDIYRDEELDPTPLEFCLYIAFWPTVLSGPVCRMPEMLPQFRQLVRPNWGDVAAGTHRIVVGLFMKVVLSQLLAKGFNEGEGVIAGFDQASGWSGLDVWTLAIGFGFQLFFDFAGYSHIAIGSARLFGFRLEENFDHPYLSLSVSSFWTRWHMSLSSWIRDYVFMPLATLRRQIWWRQLALVLAMLLFGFWHGATLPFVLWGLYHGVLLAGHRQWQQWMRRSNFSLPAPLAKFLSWGLTFLLICLGWIFFRAQDMNQVAVMLKAVVTLGGYRHLALRPNFYMMMLLVVGGYFLWSALEAMFLRLEKQRWGRAAFTALSPIYYAAALILIVIWSKQQSVFVYFQF